MSLLKKDIQTLLLSIVGAELSGLRGRYVYFGEADLSSSLSEAPFFIDSLEFLHLASFVSDYFRVYETGVEDLFLRYKTLDSWASIIFDIKPSKINFQTSGSSGKPKIVTHNIEELRREALYLAQKFHPFDRVVSLAYSHHIYGFITTILLSRIVSSKSLTLSLLGSRRLENIFLDKDLVVSTPYIYKIICEYEFKSGVMFVSSTSLLQREVCEKLLKSSGCVWEIYGSSETAGVGIRSSCDAPFSLFEYLENKNGQIYKKDELLPLQDKLEWKSDTLFYPVGRIDKAVQVGGVNVHIGALRSKIIEAFEEIEDMAVRLDKDGYRLKAAIATNGATFDLDKFFEWQSKNLSSVERIKSVSIFDALPTGMDGKLLDWD